MQMEEVNHRRFRRAEACLAAYEANGADLALFKNVTHLSIGSDLASGLMHDIADDIISTTSRLQLMLRPTHLCISDCVVKPPWDCQRCDLKGPPGITLLSDRHLRSSGGHLIGKPIGSFDWEWDLDSLFLSQHRPQNRPAE